MKQLRFRYLLAAIFAFAVWLPCQAQLHRSARTAVRGGMMERPDTLRHKRDSMRLAALVNELDSLQRSLYTADSTALYAMRTDNYRISDSIYVAGLVAGSGDTAARAPRVFKKGWFMSDSMSLSKVCWLSTVLPGYGQVYNKQYWKLPILYGLVGTGLAMYISESKTYRPLRDEYDNYINQGKTQRTPELDVLQARMIRSNTKRQLYLGATIASYIYFIGDAAVNYKTNNVSHVKKATTLACIFPGAGQIYNKSYWKVPFVIGGFASMIYTIDWNNRMYKRFKTAYSLAAAYKENPSAFPDGPPDEFRGQQPPEYLKDLRNNARRNRDLCIILCGALYILQIVDAHVDAHLKDYDVSDDLSMNLEPMINATYVPAAGGNRPVFGFNLSLKF